MSQAVGYPKNHGVLGGAWPPATLRHPASAEGWVAALDTDTPPAKAKPCLKEEPTSSLRVLELRRKQDLNIHRVEPSSLMLSRLEVWGESSMCGNSPA